MVRGSANPQVLPLRCFVILEAVIKSLSDAQPKIQTLHKEKTCQFGAKHLNRSCIQDFRNLQEAEKDGEV